MKRTHFMLFIAGLLLVLAATPSFALTDAEYKKFMAESAAFRSAEKALANAWQHALDTLNDEKLAEIKAEQRTWIRSGRDEEARALIQSGHSRVNSYARATVDRAKNINGYISFAETHGLTKGSGNRRPQEGLSDDEYRRLLAESQEFRFNERKLAEAMQRAREDMPTVEYRRLLANQQNWLKVGRNAAAKEYMDSGYSKAEAYSEATLARIRYINNSIGDYSDQPNKRTGHDITGTYQREGMSAREFIEVRWQDRSQGILHIELCQRDGRGKIQVSFMNGQLRENTVVARDTADDNLSVKIEFNDNGGGGGAVVTTNSAFKRFARNLPNQPSFDGSYGK